MHIPTLTSCLNHFKNHHLQVEEDHDAYTTSMQQNVSHRPDGPPPSPKYVLILAQHVRDRRAPWRLNDVLAAHLFNHGIRLITLHDKIEHQRARAETRDLPFVPSSKFGRYRHDYEWLIPSLKFFSPSTLLTRSFQPFAYDELENYESAVSWTSSQPCSLCGGLLPSRPLRLTRKGSGTFLCMEFTAGQRI